MARNITDDDVQAIITAMRNADINLTPTRAIRCSEPSG